MKEFWSKRIRDAVPYVPGEQPKEHKWIKLNTNENPYGPSPKVLQAITRAANEDLRLYPDPDCTQLRQAAAEQCGVSPEQVFCGNGSDEILAFSFQAFFDAERPIVFPEITYSFYPVYAEYFQLTYREIPMKPDFTLPMEQFYGQNGGVVLPNPNAPTGIAISLDEVELLIQQNPSAVVLIDEAYVDFGAQSAVSLIDQYPNLLVVQTLSKSHSMAGMRVGYAMGQENLIRGLCCVRDSINSYTVDRVAQAAAAAALQDREYFDGSRQKIMETREKTADALKERGFAVCPSKSNFLFFRSERLSGEEIFQALREHGILVRHWNSPKICQWLRVSIGTEEDMEVFLQALDQIDPAPSR